MARSISEKKALKLLGIPDFRHLTKDKVVEFTAMMSQMDKDVALKALEQLPEYTKLATEIVLTYRDVIDKIFASNTENSQVFYCACNQILNSLDRQLREDNLSFEEKDQLNQQMIKVAQLIHEHGQANKQLFLDILGKFGQVALGFAVVAGAIMGVKIKGSNNKI